MAHPGVRERIGILRASFATLLSFLLLITPLYATPSATFGTVVFADHARVGNTFVSVGATVFGGDRLSTEQKGNLQVRAGAARLLLADSSSAVLAQEAGSPAANLTRGTATFSTANARAFAVRVSSAVIRPATDQPTIGKVIVLNAKELAVKSVRGPLTVAVEDDIREIPEGMAYHIVLDSNTPYPQGPQGAGGKTGMGAPPIKAARERKFIWFAIAVTGLITYFVLDEAWESDPRP